jgi:hypothetical protein
LWIHVTNETNGVGRITENSSSAVKQASRSEAKEIHLDAAFLGAVNLYIVVLKYINQVRSFKKDATYKVLRGIVSIMVFISQVEDNGAVNCLKR